MEGYCRATVKHERKTGGSRKSCPDLLLSIGKYIEPWVKALRHGMISEELPRASPVSMRATNARARTPRNGRRTIRVRHVASPRRADGTQTSFPGAGYRRTCRNSSLVL